MAFFVKKFLQNEKKSKKFGLKYIIYLSYLRFFIASTSSLAFSL